MLTVFPARRIRTLDDECPRATAVSVSDGRIVAVGTLDEVLASCADEPHVVDDSLADHVVLPGLIDQHLHPLLGATTLATEVIATEDWVLPDRTYPAATTIMTVTAPVLVPCPLHSDECRRAIMLSRFPQGCWPLSRDRVVETRHGAASTFVFPSGFG